jgi:hypothetical protein
MKMKIKNGMRYEKNGWIHVSIKGNAKERGYAHGYLVKSELKEIMKMLDFDLMDSYGYSREFFTEVMSELYGPQIKANYPELYDEMNGIAMGSGLTINDIILWNCFVSIDSMIGPLPSLIKANSKLNEKYGKLFADDNGGSVGHGEGGGAVSRRHNAGQNDRCTGFIAVGSYTKDGKIVCGHNSFDNFIDGQYMNVMIDITPTGSGARILMQACAGWIYSGSDFYVTSSGFICTETTIGGFNKFVLKDPICCRIRQAMQYATSLEECATILTTNNGGDYANSWLIGDVNNNTIMRIELGLRYVNIEIKKDGYFIGYNAPEDPQIRNLECANTGYHDVRRHQGARRVRLTQLMEQHKGKLDVTIGEEILADHYDVYLNKINPCSRTCCGHYELDDRAYMSDPSRPKPYQPRGALDGIVCDTALAKNMSLIGRWGSSCGTAFDKTEFCRQHIQWREQEPFLKDRPSEEWTEFRMGALYPHPRRIKVEGSRKQKLYENSKKKTVKKINKKKTIKRKQ